MEHDEDLLKDALAQLAVALFNEKSLAADLDRLVRLVTGLVPTSSGASIALLVEGAPTTVATTDRVTLELDVVQYADNDGPCIAAASGNAVRVVWTEGDEQFPHFAVGAADRRVRSVLSTPIRKQGRVVGTLNIYSHESDGFDEQDATTAAVVAAEAANAIVKSELFERSAQIRDELQRDAEESATIAQAQGVIMAFEDCSAEQAMELLRNASGATGEQLIEVARRVLDRVVADDS